jgi:CheY-like chemotaxis protein
MPHAEVALIYVIEDDPITASITKLLLEKALGNVHVHLYANGQRALDNLQLVVQAGAKLPDLVLLDLEMPLMDGWEFLAAFSDLPLTHPVCVLLLTSSINPEDRAKATHYPTVGGYFSKPLEMRVVSRMLRVQRAANGPGLEQPNLPGTLHYLVYQSYATLPFGDQELAKLLTQSRAFNAAHNLTGVLLYSEGHIVQVLEGSEANVQAVFARIVQDPRHGGIIKLADGVATQRLFTQWSMGFQPLQAADFTKLTGYINPNQKEYLGLRTSQPNDELYTLLADFIDNSPLTAMV